jgi:hypothetical protein
VLNTLKTGAATKDIPVVICTSRILTAPERLLLSGRTIAILSKEEPECNDLAGIIHRTVNAGQPAAI